MHIDSAIICRFGALTTTIFQATDWPEVAGISGSGAATRAASRDRD